MFTKSCRLLISGILTSAMLGGFQTAFASSYLDVSYRYWKPNIRAKVGPAQLGGVRVNWLDAKQQLGLGNYNIHDLRLSWRITENSKIQLASFSDSSTATATPEFSMNGWNLSVGTFKTDVDVKDLQANWVKYTNRSTDGNRRHGFMLGLRNVRIDVASNQLDGANHFSKNFNILFPTVGLVLETGRNSPIGGFASLSGAYMGSNGYFYDTEVGVKAFMDVKKTFSATLGYRYLKIKANKDNGDKLDVTMSGPFFGIEKFF